MVITSYTKGAPASHTERSVRLASARCNGPMRARGYEVWHTYGPLQNPAATRLSGPRYVSMLRMLRYRTTCVARLVTTVTTERYAS